MQVLEQRGVRGHDQQRVVVNHRPVGFQRTHIVVELRITPKGFGIDRCGPCVALALQVLGLLVGLGKNDLLLAVGIAADLPRLFFALGAVTLGDTLALGDHAVEDTGVDFLRQVGALDPHVHDLDAEGVQAFLSSHCHVRHDRLAPLVNDLLQLMPGKLCPQLREDDVIEPRQGRPFGPDAFEERKRLDDPPTRHVVHDHALLVEGQIFRRRRVGAQDTLIEATDGLDERCLDVQPRRSHRADGPPELRDDHLIDLVNEVEDLWHSQCNQNDYH